MNDHYFCELVEEKGNEDITHYFISSPYDEDDFIELIIKDYCDDDMEMEYHKHCEMCDDDTINELLNNGAKINFIDESVLKIFLIDMIEEFSGKAIKELVRYALDKKIMLATI
ncbi:MAG: hypothetical protein KBT35_01315 [Firmicutes bacterium]|nr:hypothetical protein [Candidatus Colivicinus equi]